jgi:TIR domain
VREQDGTVAQQRRIFISHVATDEAWADAFAEALRRAGYVITLPRDALAGRGTIAEVLEATVSSSDGIVVLVSDRSASSPWVRAEIASARAANKPVVSVRIEEGASIPADVYAYLLVDAADTRLEEAVDRVVAALTGALPATPSLPDTLPPLPSAAPDWVARTLELAEIDRALVSSASSAGPRTVVLVGVGGVGKTVVARQFVESRRDNYESIHWTSGANLFRLEDFSRDHPRSGSRALLVIDDVEDYHDLARKLPRDPQFDILVVSRNPNWGPPFAVVDIPLLSQTAAIDFLRLRLARLPLADLARLAQTFGGLPLALNVAAHLATEQSVEALLEQLSAIQATLAASEAEGKGFYYLDTDDPVSISEFERAFAAAVSPTREIAFEAPERGSWRRRWSKRYDPEHVETLLDKAERAVEVASLAKPEGQANRDNAEAIARLMESSSAIPNMVISSGSVLFIKITDGDGSRVFCKTLSATEMRRIEENQHVLSKPADALAFLDVLRQRPGELDAP